MKNILPVCLLFLFPSVALLAQAGTPDPGFGTAGIVTTSFSNVPADCKAMALQPDGKILQGGVYTLGGLGNMALARFTTSGAPDATFGSGGKAIVPFSSSSVSLSAIGLLADGKIIAAGSSNAMPTIVRLSAAGIVDNSFGTAGVVTFSNDVISILDLKVIAGGKMVGCGLADQGNGKLFTVFRRNADGSADNSFGTGGFTYTDIGNLETLTRMAIQPDGKILLTGTVYASASTLYDLVLVRYTANGAIDTGFGTNGIVTTVLGANNAYEQGNRIAIQPDGKILVASRIANSGPTVYALTRFTAAGAKDTGFGTNGTVTTNFNNTNDEPKAIALQADGKILLAGSSTSGSSQLIALARYTSSGALDNSFGTGGKQTTAIGTKAYGEEIMVQSDNKILVAGYATINNLRQFALVRYLPGTVATQNPLDLPSAIKLFPNPVTQGHCTLSFGLNRGGMVGISIFDAVGRVVKNLPESYYTEGNQEVAIDLPALLAPGAYFLRIAANGATTGMSFMVE